MASLNNSTINQLQSSLGNSSLVNQYIGKANVALSSDANFMNSLLKMQQAKAAISQNTSTIQSQITNAQNGITDATYQASVKQGQSGLGNTGAGAVQGVSSTANDQNLENSLVSTANSDKSTQASYDLYDQNVQGSLKNEMALLLNQDINSSSQDWSDHHWYGTQHGNTSGYDVGGDGDGATYNKGTLAGVSGDDAVNLEKQLLEQSRAGTTDPISDDNRQKAQNR